MIKEFDIKLHITRTIMKIFYIFSINRRKVFFSSFEGKQFSCNPKYIFLELKECGNNLQFVYELNIPKIPKELKNVTVVKHNTWKYFYHLLTSKVVISNNAISPKIPIRRSQYVINTWHGGGAFKKVGIDIDGKVNGMDYEKLKITAKQTSLFLASSEGFYNGTGKGSCIPLEKVLFVGMPRNDILLAEKEKKDEINRKVRNFYKIDAKINVLLYAPTFRGAIGSVESIRGESFEWEKVRHALEQRFPGEWLLVFRGHYHSKENVEDRKDVIDASTYPDMQELLIAADTLITDYSSVIWDFSLTNKPGFLFCPDLETYIDERDFYSPIEIWPYNYACNNKELCDLIYRYDASVNKARCAKYHDKMISYEDGNSSEIVARLINRELLI